MHVLSQMVHRYNVGNLRQNNGDERKRCRIVCNTGSQICLRNGTKYPEGWNSFTSLEIIQNVSIIIQKDGYFHQYVLLTKKHSHLPSINMEKRTTSIMDAGYTIIYFY